MIFIMSQSCYVDRKAADLPLRSGDTIMVTQIKGDLREVTARRFQGSAPNCEFRFESTVARYSGTPQLIRDLEQTSTILGGRRRQLSMTICASRSEWKISPLRISSRRRALKLSM
jgi:hypothetical protein